jgi:hypothetical protein
MTTYHMNRNGNALKKHHLPKSLNEQIWISFPLLVVFVGRYLLQQLQALFLEFVGHGHEFQARQVGLHLELRHGVHQLSAAHVGLAFGIKGLRLIILLFIAVVTSALADMTEAASNKEEEGRGESSKCNETNAALHSAPSKQEKEKALSYLPIARA